jgi:hypothetical protein
MQNDLLTPKIELLQEQIDNLERSGFFTEEEMDRATVSLKIELLIYTQCQALNTYSSNLTTAASSMLNFTETVAPKYKSGSDFRYEEVIREHNENNTSDFLMETGKLAMDSMKKVAENNKYGMDDNEYKKGIEVHTQCFDQMKTVYPNNITVVAAEILTPSIQ